MTPEMTTSNQLQSSKIVLISYFGGPAVVVILFAHILARPRPFRHKQRSLRASHRQRRRSILGTPSERSA